MKLGPNHFSFAFIGLLLGLAMLPIGQIVDCSLIAGTTTTFKCDDGTTISLFWKVMAFTFIGTGITLWLLRNNTD